MLRDTSPAFPDSSVESPSFLLETETSDASFSFSGTAVAVAAAVVAAVVDGFLFKRETAEIPLLLVFGSLVCSGSF